MTKLTGKSLIILELTILGLFFIFAAATCIYSFVNASTLSSDAKTLDAAVVRTTSIAETLKATNGNLNKTGNRIGQRNSYDVVDSQLLIYLDEDMVPITKSKSTYTAKVTKSLENKCKVYDINIVQGDSTIYKLNFKSIKGGGAAR